MGVYALGDTFEIDAKNLMKSKLLDEFSVYEVQAEGINFHKSMKGLVGDLISDMRGVKSERLDTSLLMRKDEEISRLSQVYEQRLTTDRELLKHNEMRSG